MNVPDPRPRVPETPLPIGLVGAGAIARTAHLPAYAAWGLPVVAVASRTPDSARALAEKFGVPTVHERVEDLLADDRIAVVDIATGPADRLALATAAVRAGKHVLAQKPLSVAAEELPLWAELIEEADERGIRIAVNQNARWAPAWRLATLLLRDGAIGDVVGVTHLHDKPLPPLVGTPFDDVPHMLISDYLVHWIDITRCWLEGSDVTSVSAYDSRVVGQPQEARNPWNADVRIATAGGATASLRIVGSANTTSGGCPFWIHGTQGTLRGSVLLGSDRLELDRDGERTDFPLQGQWFTDGFAGAMGELQTAVVEQRTPENSAAHVIATVRLGLAAARSAEAGGSPVHPTRLTLDPTPTRKAPRS